MKISATAEPSNLHRDVTPSDFQLWLLKFNTFSSASWIPGPPTSGEKLCQLRVYLGTAWQDVTEGINFDTSTFDEFIKNLTDELSMHYPVVEQSAVLLKASSGKSKGMVNAVNSGDKDKKPTCSKCILP